VLAAVAGALLVWNTGAHAASVDAHAERRATPATTRTSANYTVPNVDLVRDDGKPVALPAELDDGRPVVLTFIFTTCGTICPVISSTLAQLQRKLGAERERVHLVSISIDPEFDTPARLHQYAKRFNAGPEWQHYSGTLVATESVERAFGLWRGDKMSHTPVVLVRSAPGAAWVRIDGFATANDLLAELPATQHASR
jgi:protein SCO1/2